VRAKVIRVESGESFTDKERRYTFQFATAERFGQNTVTFCESALPSELRGLELDYEVDVVMVPVGVRT
jgi:hypothetical protein